MCIPIHKEEGIVVQMSFADPKNSKIAHFTGFQTLSSKDGDFEKNYFKAFALRINQ